MGNGARWPHDAILHAWWVEPDRLLAGEYPGATRPEEALQKASPHRRIERLWVLVQLVISRVEVADEQVDATTTTAINQLVPVWELWVLLRHEHAADNGPADGYAPEPTSIEFVAERP